MIGPIANDTVNFYSTNAQSQNSALSYNADGTPILKLVLSDIPCFSSFKKSRASQGKAAVSSNFSGTAAIDNIEGFSFEGKIVFSTLLSKYLTIESYISEGVTVEGPSTILLYLSPYAY